MVAVHNKIDKSTRGDYLLRPYIITSKTTYLSQRNSPPLYLIYIITKVSFMFIKELLKLPTLSSNIRRINIEENGDNKVTRFANGLRYLCQLIQTPRRVSVVVGENDKGNSRLLNSFKEILFDGFSFVESFVVFEGENTFALKSRKKVTSESVASILTSETQKNFVLPRPTRS